MSAVQNILRRVGPGLITASVVLGPGSIIASSKAGAEAGYSLVWIIVVAGLLMATYTAMGARLGCALDQTLLQYVASRWGRPLAAITGMSAFFVCAGFQFGNNLGVAFAVSGVTHTPLWIWPLAFTALSVVFLFFARQVYKVMERLMMALVAVMIVCFFANLIFTGFSPVAFAGGLVPRIRGEHFTLASAMLATNFSVIAAFYQSYLVRAKGWGKTDVETAIRDAWVGIAILCSIAMAILVGSAESLFGTGATFTTVGDLANQLATLLGPAANIVFCLGLGAASFSSFIVNALVGGCMLADGFGLESDVNSRSGKLWGTACMLLGCGVAVLVLTLQVGGPQSIIIAQASTLIAAPLAAFLMVILASSRRVMGDMKNGIVVQIFAVAGLLLICFLFYRTASGLIAKIAG